LPVQKWIIKRHKNQQWYQEAVNLADQRGALQKEFNSLLGGGGGFFSGDPASNIKPLFKKIDEQFERRISNCWQAKYPENEKLSIQAEQAKLYQSAINGLNKVGLKEFNKKCKDITTKEQLVNYLNSIK